MILTPPYRRSISEFERREHRGARISATPPPATTPSSTAARVADSASSTRNFCSLNLDLGRAADLDDGNAAGQLRQPLLQLLAVELRT